MAFLASRKQFSFSGQGVGAWMQARSTRRRSLEPYPSWRRYGSSSSAKAKKQAETRKRHWAKIRAEFEQVGTILGNYSLKTEAAIRRRLEQARSKYPEGKVFWEVRVVVADRRGGVGSRARAGGVFVLKAQMPKREHPLAAVLAQYREQITIEKRIHDRKRWLSSSFQ